MSAVISVVNCEGCSGAESESESGANSESINIDPKNMVFVRKEKNRVIWPRWKASQALELPKP